MIYLCNKYIKTVNKGMISTWSNYRCVIFQSSNLMSHEYNFSYYFLFFLVDLRVLTMHQHGWENSFSNFGLMGKYQYRAVILLISY
jgi:hypothetical protein